MRKNCCYCGSVVEVPATSTYTEVCCPACVTKIEKVVLSEGLVVPAPEELGQAVYIFKKYFQKYGFSEFKKYMGCTEEDFREAYIHFKISVESYYSGYCAGHGYKYAPGEEKYPLIAEVCSYYEVDFFSSMWKDYRVQYPAVSVIVGAYYVSPPGKRIEFLECEEVMKRMLFLYWVNKEFFDKGKTLAENPRKNPVPAEYAGKVSLEVFN